jgi:hypothetical protein
MGNGGLTAAGISTRHASPRRFYLAGLLGLHEFAFNVSENGALNSENTRVSC